MVVLFCEKCGKSFESEGIGPRFCSNACRKAAREDVTKCARCGKDMYFPPRRGAGPIYCSRECAYRAKLESNLRGAHAKAKRLNREMQILAPSVHGCEWCGAEYVTLYPWARYCSTKCRRAAERARAKARAAEAAAVAAAAEASSWMECARCHEPFERTDPDARPPYCSERCERLAKRAEEMAAATRKAHAANVRRHREFVRAEAAAKAPTDWEW